MTIDPVGSPATLTPFTDRKLAWWSRNSPNAKYSILLYRNELSPVSLKSMPTLACAKTSWFDPTSSADSIRSNRGLGNAPSSGNTMRASIQLGVGWLDIVKRSEPLTFLQRRVNVTRKNYAKSHPLSLLSNKIRALDTWAMNCLQSALN
jgi:hypothetical protein